MFYMSFYIYEMRQGMKIERKLLSPAWISSVHINFIDNHHPVVLTLRSTESKLHLLFFYPRQQVLHFSQGFHAFI